jgi:hypothetical protein
MRPSGGMPVLTNVVARFSSQLLNFERTRGSVEAAVIRRRDGVAKLANIEDTRNSPALWASPRSAAFYSVPRNRSTIFGSIGSTASV